MQCASCTTKNPDHAIFCSYCGLRQEQEIQLSPVSSIPVPGEHTSTGHAPDEELIIVQQSASIEQNTALQAFLATSPSALSPAPIASLGKQIHMTILSKLPSPTWRYSTKQPHITTPTLTPWPTSVLPSAQHAPLYDEALPAVPAIPFSAFAHDGAKLSVPTNGRPLPTELRTQLLMHWKMTAPIALILLLIVGSSPFLLPQFLTFLPAATATVTITPASQHLTRTYAISVVTGTPIASRHEIQGHPLSFTTPMQSRTVQATGTRHADATRARGQVTIFPARGTVPAGNLYISSNSGIPIVIYVTNPVSSDGQTFDAWAENAGPGGNIAAYDINSSYRMGKGKRGTTYYLENSQAFTGGQDAQDYQAVQQNDIDAPTTALQTSLTTEAQTGLKNLLHADEQLVTNPNDPTDNGIQCTPNITSDHQANDRATNVTITGSVTCTGEAYSLQAAQAMTVDLLKSEVASQVGPHYTLTGNVATETPIIITTDQEGTVSMQINVRSVWAFQFTKGQQQRLAKLIAGKTLAEATSLLLKQEGIASIPATGIQTSGGWGKALPTSPTDIKLVPLNMRGL